MPSEENKSKEQKTPPIGSDEIDDRGIIGLSSHTEKDGRLRRMV